MYIHIGYDSRRAYFFIEEADDFHEPWDKCKECVDIPKEKYLRWKLAIDNYRKTQNEIARYY